MSDAILCSIDPLGVASVTINRPAIKNAFDDALIKEMTALFKQLGADARVRAVTLTGAGTTFSAGGDLNWMRRVAGYSREENLADAALLAELMFTLNHLPKPTIALVNGVAYAGAVGLVACCDVAIAVEEAVFCISEVKVGIIPSAISPYVVAAIGQRQARRYFQTAEVFSAETARDIGLVHEVVSDEGLVPACERVLKAIFQGGPEAQAHAKDTMFYVTGCAIDDALKAETGRRIAERRASAEGREGLAAFLEKRKPAWIKG